jgi:hypothetical protein
MRLKKNEREFLATFVAVAQKMLDSSTNSMARNGSRKRKRRSAADVVLLKKQILSARKRKVPVKAIADELGITTAYVYQIGK